MTGLTSATTTTYLQMLRWFRPAAVSTIQQLAERYGLQAANHASLILLDAELRRTGVRLIPDDLNVRGDFAALYPPALELLNSALEATMNTTVVSHEQRLFQL
jgi:hypothetical protein